MIFLSTITTVTFFFNFLYTYLKKQKNCLSIFGKSNLTHLTTGVMFSGQRFAIFAMFFERLPDFVCGEVA